MNLIDGVEVLGCPLSPPPLSALPRPTLQTSRKHPQASLNKVGAKSLPVGVLN